MVRTGTQAENEAMWRSGSIVDWPAGNASRTRGADSVESLETVAAAGDGVGSDATDVADAKAPDLMENNRVGKRRESRMFQGS